MNLIVDIQQVTPMLHFQFDQPGATLRATELKPKLDEYLWKSWGENPFDIGKNFMIGKSSLSPQELQRKYSGGFRALDYKIQVLPSGQIGTRDPQGFPLYFGNMQKEGEEKKPKWLGFSNHRIVLKFTCFYPRLLREIELAVARFFALHNFGTRQNKGFGSFQVVAINGRPEAPQVLDYYYFDLEDLPVGNIWNNSKELFFAIDLFYRSIRSGLNLKRKNRVTGNFEDRLYFKSLLFQYARQLPRNHSWDKRKIRIELFERHPKFREVLNKRPEDPESTLHFRGREAYLYRDLLGLSSVESWYVYNATVNKKAEGIDRYKSPITFKPVKLNENSYRIYLIAGTIPPEMLGTKFTIDGNRNNTELTTPEEFSLSDYLTFVCGFFNQQSKTPVEDYVGDHDADREVSILENIYGQLTKQV